MVLARRLHRVFNTIVLIGVPIQFYAAGLAAFGAAEFTAHARVGWSMILCGLLSALLSLAARRSGVVAGLPALLAGLLVLQPVLAFGPRDKLPAVAALHTVNALAVAVIAWRVELSLRRSSSHQIAATTAPARMAEGPVGA